MLEGAHCFASAADDGSLHVVRVHVAQSGTLPKYSKLQVVREHRTDTPGEYITSMVHYSTETASNLIYATTHSIITILDLRTMRPLQRMENARHHGPITCICLDRKRTWVIAGTSTGVLSLWDIRFGILVKSWRVGVALEGRFGRVHQCVVHPTKGKGKWVVVAVETPKAASDIASHTLLEVWDVEKSALVEAFSTRAVVNPSDAAEEPREVAVGEAEVSPAAAIAALVRARQEGGAADAAMFAEAAMPPFPDVRAVVTGSEFGGHTVVHRSHVADVESKSGRSSGRGFVITGSEDCKLRYWDLGRPEKSVILSGVDAEGEKPTYSSIRAPGGTASSHIETWVTAQAGSQHSRPPQRLSLINHNQQNLLKGHQDTITALACIDSPFRGGLVSGDRAGVIKVWRVEAFEQS
ncbi:WD40-repeat-containing domain protein [Epithele typhae]|uniref:WD40-repeat-containing domain protein n=1 Tax=Epithele typhae TaxID=378194 RepID=UPI0020080702|nr:WD40-repeat-containing domain protein [Epithele typhae]KAH9937765.1 WD40-repeat-containing domain protein [Epithele typhae]